MCVLQFCVMNTSNCTTYQLRANSEGVVLSSYSPKFTSRVQWDRLLRNARSCSAIEKVIHANNTGTRSKQAHSHCSAKNFLVSSVDFQMTFVKLGGACTARPTIMKSYTKPSAFIHLYEDIDKGLLF